MALLLAESFDTLVNPEDKYSVGSTGYVNINNTIYLTGRGSLYHGIGSYQCKFIITAISTGVVGFAFRRAIDTTANKYLLRFCNGATDIFQINISAAGQVRWYHKQGTDVVLGYTSKAYRNYAWLYIEVKWSISTSIAADSCIVRINGEEVINLPATTNTQGGGLSTIDGVWTYASFTYIDDLYICDLTGAQCNDFLGPVACELLLPDGNGNQNDFTGSDADSTNNYLHVDEDEQDGNTSYVESSTVGHIDLYSFANMANTPTTIYAVIAEIYANKDDASAKTGKIMARVNGSNYEGADLTPVEADYDYFQEIWELNPDDAAAWEEADVNAAEFGVKVEA